MADGMKSSIQVGETFQGAYEILSQLGAGGFGEVYKARQLTTGQLVAVKVILPERESRPSREQIEARFIREMKLCAHLHHPNIVRLIDSGKTDDGQLYTVFAYVPGKSLKEVLAEEGALDPVEAARIMGQILDALAAAHDHGVVHRDLKPGNIMLSTMGARRNAMVLDFGIGAFIGTTVDEEISDITGAREMLGTPAYASPEQLRGGLPTPRADLYSWGLVFLECLTGRRVMYGKTINEILYKQLGPVNIPVPVPITRHEVATVLRKATAKDMDERDMDARSLLEALEAMEFASLRGAIPRTNRSDTDAYGSPTTTKVVEELQGKAFRETGYSWDDTAGELRQLTVVGCTFSMDDPSGEEDLERFERHDRANRTLCGVAAGHHAGLLGSVLGDQIILYFGYPLAQEDDVTRATRAARDIASRAQEQGIGVRIGVHTGMVITRSVKDTVGDTIQDVVGTAPKVALHLSGLAAVGEVVVSGETRKLLKADHAFEPCGEQPLSGFGRPITAHVLRGDAEQSMSLTTLFGEDAMPMAGRVHEMNLLQDRWQQAVGGTGSSILITGEAGIGKSRLARELVRAVEDGTQTWLECRCVQESRHSALFPVIDLLIRLAGVSPEDGEEAKLECLTQLCEGVSLDTAQTIPLLAPLLGIAPDGGHYQPPDVSPQKLREMTLEALLSLLFQMSHQQPLLLVVEDLHWADPTTLELLALLVQDAASSALCAVLTARPEFEPTWSGGDALRIQLPRLDHEAVRQLMESMTDGRSLPREVVELVERRTDGVALFVEELTRHVLDSGLLEPRAGRYELAGPLSESVIPDSLRGLLAARLDTVGDAKTVAQLASAIGREFALDLLGAVAGIEGDDIRRSVDRLVEADLVRRSRRGAAVAYGFKHALIRDMAYRSMLTERRVSAHGSIAAALEEQFPQIVQTRPDLLAHHHAAAEQKPQALGYALQAGMGALMRSANAEAIQQATAAKEWLDALPDARAQAEMELQLNGIVTPAMMATRGWGDPSILEVVRRSEDLLEEVGEAPQLIPTLWALTLYQTMVSNTKAARSLADRLLGLADAMGDVGQRVATLPMLGTCQIETGEFSAACDSFEEVSSKYDIQQHGHHAIVFGMDSLAYALMQHAYVFAHMGRFTEGIELTHRAESAARAVNHALSIAMSVHFRAMVHALAEQRAEVAACAGSVLELATKHGLPAQQAYGAILLGWATNNEEMIGGAIQGLEMMNYAMGMPWYRTLLATMQSARGDHDAALALLGRSVDQARETGEVYYLAGVLTCKGRTLMQRDPAAVEAAEACFVEAADLAREHGATFLELQAVLGLAGLLAERGEAEAGSAQLAQVLERMGDEPGVPAVEEARKLLS